ncbi:hydrolase [Streptomyces sp. NPDC059002]|uniref:hydrolase n=1 Tax=Streptomyces sp. NPDC059002 TaxID=3346690 RepID=UPI0036AD3546
MTSQVPTRSGVPTAVERAARIAAGRAAAADTERALHPEVVEAIVEAGLARHFVPAQWGGEAGSCGELLDSVAAIGESCTSAAWCASVLAGAARMGAYLPEAGQQELWAKGADTKVVGALMPRGTATAAPGGWRLTGEWEFTSGADFADWAMVCALVPAGEHAEAWYFAVPRDAYEVADTWFNVGMRGTASNTLVLDEVFVPEERAFLRSDMMTGNSVMSSAHCHTAPLRLLSGLIFGAPALGAARGALRAWSAWSASAAPGAADGIPQERRLTAARVSGAVDAAGLLLERAARVADSGAATPAEASRNPSDCAFAVHQLVDSVEQLFRSAGSRGQLESQPLQRIWRDVHCLASHAALRFDAPGAAYGGHLLTAVR